MDTKQTTAVSTSKFIYGIRIEHEEQRVLEKHLKTKERPTGGVVGMKTYIQSDSHWRLLYGGGASFSALCFEGLEVEV